MIHKKQKYSRDRQLDNRQQERTWNSIVGMKFQSVWTTSWSNEKKLNAQLYRQKKIPVFVKWISRARQHGAETGANVTIKNLQTFNFYEYLYMNKSTLSYKTRQDFSKSIGKYELPDVSIYGCTEWQKYGAALW